MDVLEKSNRVLIGLESFLDHLVKCGGPVPARVLLQEKVNILLAAKEKVDLEFLESIKKLLYGPGSLTDLPLNPKRGSGLTEKEAESLAYLYAGRLWKDANKLALEFESDPENNRSALKEI